MESIIMGYMGDCQNYGPFLGPYYNTGPNTGPNLGTQKGTIILTTTHIVIIGYIVETQTSSESFRFAEGLARRSL